MQRIPVMLAILLLAATLPAHTLAQDPPPVYVGQVIGMYGVSLETNDMLRRRSVDPSDSAYLALAGATWVVYQAMDKSLRPMTPPPAFAETHALLLSATGYLNSYAPQCIPLFMQGDPVAVQPCFDYMREGKMQLLTAFMATMLVADSLGILSNP